MNGRIYDAKLGRFLQADPQIDGTTNTQGYNRYSYVHNNPLNTIDPSGYGGIKKFVGAIVGAALVYFTGGIASSWFVSSWYGAATLGGIAGGVGAAANGGNILQGVAMGAFSGAAFYGVGSAFSQANCASCFNGAGELTTTATIGKIAAHGMAGGVMSTLQGGKFGHGFAAAGVTQGFAGKINGINTSSRFSLARIGVAAVVGGTVSKLTGGKFANGATTGAFSRMFNDEGNPLCQHSCRVI